MMFAGALLGTFGWSGRSSTAWLPLLFPFVYLLSRSRLEAGAFTVAYYMSAAWPVMTGARAYFGDQFSPLLAPSLLLLGTIAGSLPWIAFYHRRYPGFSAIGALVLLALPPLSAVSVAYPLIAAGKWFPASHWFGLVLPLGALAVAVLPSERYRLAPLWILLTLAFVAAALRFAHHTTANDPNIVCINTRFGGSLSGTRTPEELVNQTRFLQDAALAQANKLVIFPEGGFPSWSTGTDQWWAGTLEELTRQNTTLLLGTTIPIPNTPANYNVLLARGAGTHLSYVQRMPVPIAMWNPGHRNFGYPIQLRAPATILVRGHRAMVLMCYEQLLAWPALESFLHHPEMIVAPSNDYWASHTRIPQIQHQAALSWAELWGIPLYEARND